MIETTLEICKHCGKKYEDAHIVPRAPYAPYYCDSCLEELNAVCGGSWMAAAFQALKNRNPTEEAGENV